MSRELVNLMLHVGGSIMAKKLMSIRVGCFIKFKVTHPKIAMAT